MELEQLSDELVLLIDKCLENINVFHSLSHLNSCLSNLSSPYRSDINLDGLSTKVFEWFIHHLLSVTRIAFVHLR